MSLLDDLADLTSASDLALYRHCMQQNKKNVIVRTIHPVGQGAFYSERYIDKEGNLSKKSNAVTKEQFEDLQKYTGRIIKEISEEILSGDISLEPYYNTKTKKTPCEYCDYKMICQFKSGTCGNNYK